MKKLLLLSILAICSAPFAHAQETKERGLTCTLAEADRSDANKEKYFTIKIPDAELNKSNEKEVAGAKYKILVSTTMAGDAVYVQLVKRRVAPNGFSMMSSGYAHLGGENHEGVLEVGHVDEQQFSSRVYCYHHYLDY
jgi:hypothetical protein